MKVLHSKGPHPSWALQSDYYSPTLAACARSVPGMAKGTTSNTWIGSLDAVELLCKRLEAHNLKFDASALKGAHDVGDPLVPIASKGIRPYQLEAARFLLDRKRALLGDAMGLGKSCSALIAARAMASNTLIVCPSYVRGVWWNGMSGGEITKWWPKQSVHTPCGTKAIAAIESAIVVIHYDILHAWAEAIREWGPRVVIFDECHALMNEGSRRSKAAVAVSADADFVWGLSGTPLTNRPRDLWSVVDIISPGRFGPFFGYGLRYCDAHQEQVTPIKRVWVFNGSSNLEELHGRLSTFMLRRTASDVALQLPPKTRQIISVEVPAKACLMPDAGAKAMRESLARSADAKIHDAEALIAGHLAEGHKVVAFTYRRSVAEWLTNAAREAGYGAEVVHGGIPTLRRGLAFERAKAAAAGHLVACTIDSCSTGIDLSYASVGVFVELTYEPQELLQAEARLHRFGQAKPVLIQYIIARGTTDELIANKVIAKLDVYEKVVGKTGESLSADLEGKSEDILGELYASIEKGKKR